MSWPHALSFSRIVAGPIVAALVLAPAGNADLAAAIIFALASLTDLIDGKLARYSQRVSPLGVFLDTTSDKVLVSLTVVALALAGSASAWIPLVIVGRELLISGLRSYAASCNRIISAHSWGKGKTAVTMTAIFFLLVAASGKNHGWPATMLSPAAWQGIFTASSWLLAIAALLTIASGTRYVVDASSLLRATEPSNNAPMPEGAWNVTAETVREAAEPAHRGETRPS
jgi:CDP-diacylglycerol--glycerol-3-phosphate 3-phosphatidyltransferase